MDFSTKLNATIKKVEAGLDQLLPPPDTRPSRLHEAMRYSLQAGGKRLRPVLVLASSELFSTDEDAALPAAVAIECVHTYSLIHDDLPCMDNDDLRRGRPTAHRKFDEPTALLAGDALLTHAFLLLAHAYRHDPDLVQKLVAELADAAGSQRLIGGQMEDLLAERQANPSAAVLDFIHRNKTAAMIEASLVCGGLVAHASPSEIETLRAVGQPLGLAFQIIDDILDATSTSEVLGKTAGKDAKADKTTYVKLHGIALAREIAAEKTRQARSALARLPGSKDFLDGMIQSLESRVH